MVDVLKIVLPKLSQLEHLHYVEELTANQILQIDDGLIRALFGAQRLRHLAISRSTVDNNLYLSKVIQVNCIWRLSTINLVQLRTGADNFQMKTFLTDLLAAARQNVRAVTLDVEELDVRPMAEDASSKQPMFPSLEHVVIKNAKMSAETARAIYTSNKLRSMALSFHHYSFQDDSFHLNNAVPATCLNISNWGSTRASRSRNRLHGFIKGNPTITHVNIRPVPGSNIRDSIVQDWILLPLSSYNKACMSLSVQGGPDLVSPATFLLLSDVKMLEQIRLEIQTQASPRVRIVHNDLKTQLRSLKHLKCLIIDGHVEGRLASKTWQDEDLDKVHEEHRPATIKNDLLALAASYVMTFPSLQVLGIENAWFEFDTVASQSTITEALFEPAAVKKAPYALKASFRVDEHLTI